MKKRSEKSKGSRDLAIDQEDLLRGLLFKR